MATAYRAPLGVSCASLMATANDASPISPPRRIAGRFLPCSGSSDHSRLRSIPTSQSSSLAAGRRGRAPRACALKVSCSFSNAPQVVTKSTWNDAVLQSDVPVLVVFWASWCGPCKMVHRVIEEIAREYAGRVKCCKLNTDDNPQVANSQCVEKIPTVMLFKNGEKRRSITGTLPKSVYVAAIEQSLSQ